MRATGATIGQHSSRYAGPGAFDLRTDHVGSHYHSSFVATCGAAGWLRTGSTLRSPEDYFGSWMLGTKAAEAIVRQRQHFS